MSDLGRLTPQQLEERAGAMHPLLRAFALTLAYLDQTRDIALTMHSNADASIRIMRMASRETAPAGYGTPEQALEDLAQMESFVASQIPIANGHALVGLWGAFEAWAKDLVVARVALMGTVPLPDEVAKLAARMGVSVPLSDVLLGHDSTCESAVVALIEDSARGKSGLGCIEARLSPLDLAVPVSKELRDTLYYAEKIRHLYAHRAGISDAKFLSECPSLDAFEGRRYPVSTDDLLKYVAAFRGYVGAVLDPIGDVLEVALPHAGEKMPEETGC